MLKKLSVALAVTSVLLSSVAQAAVLDGVSDAVLVNHGKGFVAATGSALVAGDTVMVKQGSKAGAAKIVYDKSCSVTVAPGSVATVAAVSPCSAQAAQDESYAADLPANRDKNAGVIVPPVEGAGFGLGAPGIIAGVAIVGGGAALIAVLAHNHKTSP